MMHRATSGLVFLLQKGVGFSLRQKLQTHSDSSPPENPSFCLNAAAHPYCMHTSDKKLMASWRYASVLLHWTSSHHTAESSVWNQYSVQQNL